MVLLVTRYTACDLSGETFINTTGLGEDRERGRERQRERERERQTETERERQRGEKMMEREGSC